MADATAPDTSTAEPSVQRWIDALNRAEKDKKRTEWEIRCRKIMRRYKDTRDGTEGQQARKFNLLWANQQTLQPVVYARCPRPEVNRRFKDEDPVGRVSSEVLERALSYTLDAYDFDGVMKLCRDDFLLYARGNAWVRYVPHMKSVQTPVTPVPAPMSQIPAQNEAGNQQDSQGDTSQDGPSVSEDVSAYEDATGRQHDPDDVQQNDAIGPHIVEDILDYEEVIADHVHYDDFIHPSVRTWPEVPWVARRAFMTRDELRRRFGDELGRQVPLDWKDEADRDGAKTEERDDADAKAAIYEVWDKRSKTAIWLSKGYTQALLDERDDPLGLPDFFPCPRPMQGTTGTDSFIPVPDYIFYQDQAQEIDDLTAKIGRLEKGLRMIGFYAGEKGLDLAELFSRSDNEMVPIADWSSLKGDGGVKGLIEWWPLDMVIQTLDAMVKMRAQLIQDVFQITGIADILRGASDPSETATAQGIKANWGAVRVRDKQKEVSRFARDIIRIMGQVIASRFSGATLAKMTGVKLFDTVAAKRGVQQQIQLQQQMAAQQMQAQRAAQAAPAPAGAPGLGGPGAPPPPQMAAPNAAPAGAPMNAPQMANAAPPVPIAMQRMLADPTWEEITALLQDEATRQFRIDVEADSTIEPDEQTDKQSRIEFLDAFSNFVQRAATAPPQMAPMLGEALKYLTRGFRAGRELEDMIDKLADEFANAPPPPPGGKGADPAALMAAQARMTQAQTGARKEQREAADAAQHLQLDAQKLALDAYSAEHARNTEFIDFGGRP